MNIRLPLRANEHNVGPLKPDPGGHFRIRYHLITDDLAGYLTGNQRCRSTR